MDVNIEDFRSGGVLPSGPVSAWPQERHNKMMATSLKTPVPHETAVRASVSTMATGLIKATGQFIQNGKVSSEIREERYNICKACPHFLPDIKRCSECGCFMEAKTWIGGNPNALCPKKKWPR